MDDTSSSPQASLTACQPQTSLTTCQPQPLVITVVKKTLRLPVGWKQDIQEEKEMLPVPMAMELLPNSSNSPYISTMSPVHVPLRVGATPSVPVPMPTTRTEMWKLCVPDLLYIINEPPPPQTGPVENPADTVYKNRIMEAFHELRFHREGACDVYHRGPCPRRPRHMQAVVAPIEGGIRPEVHVWTGCDGEADLTEALYGGAGRGSCTGSTL